MYEVVFSFSFAVVVNLSLIVSIVLMVRCCTLKLIYIVNVQSLYMLLAAPVYVVNAGPNLSSEFTVLMTSCYLLCR